MLPARRSTAGLFFILLVLLAENLPNLSKITTLSTLRGNAPGVGSV